jgi:hypothetical protein
MKQKIIVNEVKQMDNVQRYLEDMLERKLTKSELIVLRVAYFSGKQRVFEKWAERLNRK